MPVTLAISAPDPPSRSPLHPSHRARRCVLRWIEKHLDPQPRVVRDAHETIIDREAMRRVGVVQIIDAMKLGEHFVALAGAFVQPGADGNDHLPRHDNGHHVAEIAGEELRIGELRLKRLQGRVLNLGRHGSILRSER